MHRTFLGSVAGGALALVLIVAPAVATAAPSGAPPSAFVRIEGAGATLLPQTLIHTTAAKSIRGHTCSGSSAIGALNLATQGNWAGKFATGNGFADFFVTRVLGEAPSQNNFWTLWVNGRSSSTGGCATAVHPDDHVLWFDCVADTNFNCTDDPLKLSIPTRIKLGVRASATVVQLDGNGHSKPVAGAAIRGGGSLAVSDQNGHASITPRHAGVFTLQALESGATPSDPVFVCVYKRSPSQCGALSSGPPVHVLGIREHQVFTKGPRELHGTAGPDPAGLTDVSFSLLRRAGNHDCSYLDAGIGTWRSHPCQDRVPSFSLGAGASWSYLLPARLPAGTYRLHVAATDGNGRRTKALIGRSVLDFEVK